MSERYAASASHPDYSHRYHVGNVGDVWKHLVWRSLTRALTSDPRPIDVIDCHAGHGAYDLGATGEWTAGIGRLIERFEGAPLGPVGTYLDSIERFGGGINRLERYPGSPLIISELLRADDTLKCFEIEPAAYAPLAELASTHRFTAVHGDGMAALEDLRSDGEDRRSLILIDPPWNVKGDWLTVPRAIIGAAARNPRSCIAVWYPIKSYTRVNAMMQTLRDAGLRCLVADLITTPLELRLNKLNGSGVCIVEPPAQVAAEIATLAPQVGVACATHGDFFELKLRGWGGRGT